MNDFVAKPIYVKEISLALQRGLAKLERLVELDLNSKEGEKMTEVNDSNVILQQELKDIDQMFAELAQAVGMDMRDELLALFFPTLDECIEGLQQVLPLGDASHIVSYAHKLKGAAGQLGATRLSGYSKSIEMAAKNGDFVTARAEFVDLKLLSEKISEQLRVV